MSVQNTNLATIWAAIVANGADPIPVADPKWNGSAHATPGYHVVNNALGGVSFTGPNIPQIEGTNRNQPLYLTVTGSNCVIAVNMGQWAFAIEKPPEGYVLGWPGINGAFDALDASTIDNDLNFLEAPQIIDFVGDGYIQSFTPHERGNFYFEYTITGTDVFTAFQGAGVCRKGPDFDYLTGYELNADDANGGAGVAQATTVYANGVEGPSIGSTAGDKYTTVGIAVSIYPPGFSLIPADFFPVALKCTPCDGILAVRKASARFG